MEPAVYVIPDNNLEQPPVYDVVSNTQVQPAPIPYNTQVHSNQFVAASPISPFQWSFRKKVLISIGTVSIVAAVIVASVLTGYFVSTTQSVPYCQKRCSYSSKCIYGYQICDGVQDCPYGDDERNCATTCLYCSYSYTCIYYYQICNGVQDCPYGDDERNCATKTPSIPTCQMYCSYTSTCIYGYQICNGVQDCAYGDDERNCATKTPSIPTCQLYCSYYYTCIYAYQICNGVLDCPFGDDERNCVIATTGTPTCQIYCWDFMFDYTCIYAYQMCDGVRQCYYGDDERNCVTATTTTATTTSPPTCQIYCMNFMYYYTCIYAYQMCDGVRQCYYGDDELNCDTRTTTAYCEKRCGSSVSCVLSSQWCDGESDCPYGEDEMSCVRLYGADFQLQVYYTSVSAWLPVCSDYWNDDFGRFACQDFGYNGSSYNRYDTLMSPYAPNGYFKLYSGYWRSKFYTSVQYSSYCYSGNVVSLHCISCGISNNSLVSRIVGGTFANLGNWPWQVNLQYITGVLCGGSIISPKWIVTAAHCVYGSYSSASEWRVFAGTLTKPSYYNAGAYFVERIIVHPGYKSYTYDNDIALMKLRDEITFGYATQPVCLPNSGMFWEAGTTTWISGWGSTYEGGSVSTYLKYAAIPLIDSNVCNQSYVYNGQITSSMICAGYLSGGVDTCQGDSGGPLVNKRNGTWWLVGDTSWGDGCARANKPGVYGNVTTFLEWIYLQMRTYR
ncbi:transmembrane serine protease 2 L homeolog isoform X2 [Xenopus laevis]|uniref:Transmembrane serine protease 2 L homeolog isoform X2 n=1 Tax=Xenopus laevis TaxID=8355 RepID=A0A8J1M712_XENLA|nr:transmembrane serine protease 2 L homeolog isoform X2 [Xenopus laevis]